MCRYFLGLGEVKLLFEFPVQQYFLPLKVAAKELEFLIEIVDR